MEKNQITEGLKTYFEKRTEVVAAYLFGSHAQGNQKQFSDIDIAVLLKHESLVQKNELATLYTVELGRLLRKDFHILIMNKAGEMILFQIFKHGKCIFQQFPHLLAKFKTTSFSRIADFGFYRKPMEESFLSRIHTNDAKV